MKIVFVYWAYEDQGSELDLRGYARAASALGHEVIVYGPGDAAIPLAYSKAIDGADALVCVFEWTTWLQHGDRMDWAKLLAHIPRERRVVIDCDGQYNDPLSVDGDHNHLDERSSRRWTEFCDSVSDKILQPTLHPLRAQVRPFFFHIYDPDWETPLDFAAKEFSMIYVGHSKFRWNRMSRVLDALAPIRARLGRVGLVGHGWDRPPQWAKPMGIEGNYFTEPARLRELNVELLPPVPFSRVIHTMSRGVMNPVVYRPLFERLGFVTCRTFETIAAGTIPLFVLEETYVRELFGASALELVLTPERGTEKIMDVLERPQHYGEIVRQIRLRFAQEHSPEARLRELIRIGAG